MTKDNHYDKYIDIGQTNTCSDIGHCYLSISNVLHKTNFKGLKFSHSGNFFVKFKGLKLSHSGKLLLDLRDLKTFSF